MGVSAVDELERVYRDQATRIRAALTARIGDLGLAEELVQDAFAEALEHWPRDGVPPNPGGWLATTARHKAIDRLRRARVGDEKLRLIAADGRAPESELDADEEVLNLIFACCHPSLARDSQVALTLRTVCGLTTSEIAAAYLCSEATMAQRLSRARIALKKSGAAIRMPDPDALGDRLDEVLSVIYLVFNEGYLASAARAPARRDLATQAVSLARLLHRLMPREAEVLGLLALLLFHESRAAARFDGWGRMIRLEQQDRTRWDHGLIAEATQILDRALTVRRTGPYQIQAAIAALHSQAATYQETDWRQIRYLYDRLDALTRSPIVRLNRAVATRFVKGPDVALAEVDALTGTLADYRLFHAVRAELLRDLGRHEEARVANERALALATNPAERELLTQRVAEDPHLTTLSRADTPDEPRS